MQLKKYIRKVTSSLVTGGADNDPSGITTYSISGAQFGFGQLWLMVLATPMLIAVQSMCTRIAHVKRKGLSTVLREHFSPVVSWIAAIILLISNTVTIGADILAVALAFELITGIAVKFWILPVTIGIWYIVLFKNYKAIAKYLTFMLVFFLAYVIAAILAKPDWGRVLSSIAFPDFRHFTKEYYVAAVAVLGTTITPYLFFWQVKEELEDRLPKKEALNEARHEDSLNAPGFIFSQTITLAIIIAATVTLSQSGGGITNATDAAKALIPVAGRFASLIFAVGIIGAGLLAIPVLAVSSASVLAETARFKHESLNDKIGRAKGFYAIITLSLLAGVAMILLQIDPLKALYYSQVLAGILAPVLILLIIIITSNKSIMGSFTNRWFDRVFGSLAFIVMVLACIMMFIS